MTYRFGGKILNIELRNGVGLDLEFCDSRPVWGQDAEGNAKPMYFEGVTLLFPLILICFGTVCDLEY